MLKQESNMLKILIGRWVKKYVESLSVEALVKVRCAFDDAQDWSDSYFNNVRFVLDNQIEDQGYQFVPHQDRPGGKFVPNEDLH